MERSLAGRGPERHRAVQQRRGPDRADRGGGSESLRDHARIRRPAGVRRAPGRADHRRGAALAGKRRYRRDRLQRRGPAQPATVPAVEHRPAQPAGRGALLQHVRRVEHDFVAGQRAARNRNPGRQRDPRHGSLRRLPESPGLREDTIMTVWSKLLSALRGGANEVGEAIVDSQALRILDQEIRDADVELRKSREALASIMARHRLAQERVEKGAAQVAEYEQYAIKALEAGNEELAREVAEKIATLENQLEGERAQVAEFAASVAQLRKSVSQAEGNIRQLKQQVDTVKATESVQKAQMAVAQRYGNSKSKLQTAVDSLERIKQRQAERAATMDAAAELASAAAPDDALDAKLRAAGIKASGNSVDGVLARLKEKGKA
ncbi:hypothetical protein PAMH19_1358 [Pseudomonas aeruginosa]|nr:hypothetical protein PAMH19_1358 [Pseudomonas aeruginosa]